MVCIPRREEWSGMRLIEEGMYTMDLNVALFDRASIVELCAEVHSERHFASIGCGEVRNCVVKKCVCRL